MFEHEGRGEQLRRTGDLDTIRRVVLVDDELGHEVRTLSPLTVLWTESRRLDVRDTVRHHVAV